MARRIGDGPGAGTGTETEADGRAARRADAASSSPAKISARGGARPSSRIVRAAREAGKGAPDRQAGKPAVDNDGGKTGGKDADGSGRVKPGGDIAAAKDRAEVVAAAKAEPEKKEAAGTSTGSGSGAGSGSAAGSRRVGVSRRSQRPVREPKPIPKKFLVAGGVAIVLLLVATVAYRPLRLRSFRKALDEGAAFEAKKSGALALAEWLRGRAIPLFKERMEGPADADVKAACAEGLVRLAETDKKLREEAVEAAAPAAKSEDPAARRIAVKALSRMVSPKSVAVLAERLAAESEERDIRLAAAEGLGGMCMKGACEALVAAARNGNGELRAAAMKGIRTSVTPAAVPILLDAMGGEDKDLASVCTAAFQVVRASAPASDLVPLLKNPRKIVRKAVLEALAERGGQDGRAAVAAGISDPEPDIRVAAVAAIGKTGIDGGPKTLMPLWDDRADDVRIALARTLGEIPGPEAYEVLLAGFGKASAGPFLDALVQSLGKKASFKDRKALAIIMGLLDKPGAKEEGLTEALDVIARGKGKKRGWKAGEWKAWYAKLLERDRKEEEAKKLAEGARATAGRTDLALQALKDVERAQQIYEECEKSAREYDEEDVGKYVAWREGLERLRVGLFISAPVDVRR
ncbi:MAG: HEAT repeat domain-containing protein [Planctomycetota bacterium]|nr:HEAT repeat domain-containing protein [Planctomycetota bacterium]